MKKIIKEGTETEIMKTFILKFFFLFAFFCQDSLLYSQNLNLDSARFFERSSEYIKAELFYEKALNSEISLDSLKVEALISLAKAKRINQKYSEGIELLKKASLISESSKSKYLILKTAINIGDYYRAINSLELSFEYFERLNEKELEGYPQLLNQYYHRKAATLNEIPDSDQLDSTDYKAIKLSKKALKIARKHNWQEALATSYNEISHVYGDQNLQEKAIIYCDSARLIFEGTSKLDYINVSKNKLGMLYALGKYNECIQLGKYLLELTKGNDWPFLEYTIMHYVANCFFAKNDSLTGYKYELLSKEKYTETIKALFEKDLTELQVEFDISNKELEIKSKEEVIKQSEKFQNRLLFLLAFLILLITAVIFLYANGIRKNIKLETLLKENAFLVGEANHRIKNNLQLIISLLSKEIRKTSSTNSQQLADIKAKIESISTLHQQLYLNEDKSTIDIEYYLNEIIKNLMGVIEGKGVKVQPNIEVNEFPVEKSLHLGLLVTELIINSLKHAFKDHWQQSNLINIELSEGNGSYKFLYQDNGIGLKENDNPKLIGLLKTQLKAIDKKNKANGYNFEIEIPK